MEIRCIIIEDERIAREGIADYISRFDFLTLAGSFDNATEGLTYIHETRPDLLFLDIHMPGMNGLELAHQLTGHDTMIIFTTAYSEYALEGYQVNSVGYLVKPVFFEDFEKAVLKARTFFERKHPAGKTWLHIKADNEDLKICTDDILYVKSLQNYVVIQLVQKSIITLLTLKKISTLLPDHFVQVHRSYLINMEKADKISGYEIQVGAHRIPVSQRMKNDVLKKFTSCLNKKNA